MSKRILLIEQRGFGDAVILSALISRLVFTKDIVIDILTNESSKDIFVMNEKIRNVFACTFWMSTHKSFNILHQCKVLHEIRNEEYDIVVEYFGDFRERLVGFLCGGKKFVSVGREEGHLFRTREGFAFLADEQVYIPIDVVNIYIQIERVFKHIGLRTDKRGNSRVFSSVSIVGIHPFASQACRCWSYEKWKVLIKKLLCNKKKICIFSSPKERKILEKQFGHLMSEKVEIFTGTLTQFMEKLKEIDLLIGLDSFSVHAAYAAGVPNVMICGANDYRMWQTPLTKVVAPKENCCQYWPCYNKPKCHGKYKCIKSISVEDVEGVARRIREVCDYMILNNGGGYSGLRYKIVSPCYAPERRCMA